MNLLQLFQWQRSEYPKFHGNKTNLVLHLFAVPLFIAASVLLVHAVFMRAWIRALLALLALITSMMIQGRGHKMEEIPPEPFTGPLNFVARFFLEQFITFPLFFLSGGWFGNLRTPRPT